jgi:hypothetical protein
MFVLIRAVRLDCQQCSALPQVRILKLVSLVEMLKRNMMIKIIEKFLERVSL